MAQKALFISLSELKKKSIISGNLDPDKIMPFIEVAQDTHIQNYLGGKLYKKLQQLILDGELNLTANANYKSLLDTYIKPMLIWYAQAEYMPFSAYQVSNGGAFKHRSENADTLTTDEINMLTNRFMETAQFYTRRFMDYMDHYSGLFPEYLESSNEDMNPDKDVNFTSWYLG
jgi:hypothetical protein